MNMGLYEQLRAIWLKAGVSPNVGVIRERIERFERKHAIRLPSSFQDYLLTVNGMKEGDVDEHLLYFLPLDVIEQENNHKPVSLDEFELIFAEYSIYSHWYVLRIKSEDSNSPVYACDGQHQKQLAPSFEAFVMCYLSSPSSVVDCW